MAKGQACQVTLTNYRRNGDAFVNYLSVTPVHNSKGQLTHYVGVQSDITELVNHKKAELAAKHQAVQVRVDVSHLVEWRTRRRKMGGERESGCGCCRL